MGRIEWDRIKIIWIIAYALILWPSNLTPSDLWPYIPEDDPQRLFEIWRELWNITIMSLGI